MTSLFSCSFHSQFSVALKILLILHTFLFAAMLILRPLLGQNVEYFFTFIPLMRALDFIYRRNGIIVPLSRPTYCIYFALNEKTHEHSLHTTHTRTQNRFYYSRRLILKINIHILKTKRSRRTKWTKSNRQTAAPYRVFLTKKLSAAGCGFSLFCEMQRQSKFLRFDDSVLMFLYNFFFVVAVRAFIISPKLCRFASATILKLILNGSEKLKKLNELID